MEEEAASAIPLNSKISSSLTSSRVESVRISWDIWREGGGEGREGEGRGGVSMVAL